MHVACARTSVLPEKTLIITGEAATISPVAQEIVSVAGLGVVGPEARVRTPCQLILLLEIDREPRVGTVARSSR